MRDRDFGLDALRALAILGVLFLHVAVSVSGIPAPLLAVFNTGWAGVDLFFVLSGFLIAGQVFYGTSGSTDGRGTAGTLGRFWVRRWTRTLPLYFALLFVYAVVKPRVFGYPFHGFSYKYFFFLQNTDVIQDYVQSWSLCIEEQFYLVFPLIFFLLVPALRASGKRKAWIWLVPLGLSVALRLVYWYRIGMPSGLAEDMGAQKFDPDIRFATLTHLDGISVGVFLAATRDTWARWSGRTRGAIGAAGVALLTGVFATVTYSPKNFALVWLLTATAVGFGALLVAVRGLPEPRGIGLPIRRIAIWSYGAYLWNSLLIRVFNHYWHGPWLAGCAIYLGATFALAAGTYYLIERPGMRLRDWVPARTVLHA